jgi:hypothetical protein
MNLNLAENTNKLLLLVVAAVAFLLTLSTYQKQIGKNLAVVLSIVTIVVVGFVGFNLMNKQVVRGNNAHVNSANNVNLVPNVDELLDEALANNLLESNGSNNGSVNISLTNNNKHNKHNGHNDHEHNEEEDVVEGFEGEGEDEDEDGPANNGPANNGPANNGPANNVSGNNGSGNNGSGNNPVDTGVLNCKDLLPGDTNSTWAQVSPSGVGDICTRNLLNSGHHVGVNTQGCSLRNANRGLRSEPPNPQTQVSPWMQTTICADLLRLPLE